MVFRIALQFLRGFEARGAQNQPVSMFQKNSALPVGAPATTTVSAVLNLPGHQRRVRFEPDFPFSGSEDERRHTVCH